MSANHLVWLRLKAQPREAAVRWVTVTLYAVCSAGGAEGSRIGGRGWGLGSRWPRCALALLSSLG